MSTAHVHEIVDIIAQVRFLATMNDLLGVLYGTKSDNLHQIVAEELGRAMGLTPMQIPMCEN